MIQGTEVAVALASCRNCGETIRTRLDGVWVHYMTNSPSCKPITWAEPK